jgi:hypothetical protein
MNKEILQKGIDQNLLVFDQDGAENKLTTRLSGLMIDVCLLNYNKRLTDIYVPTTMLVPDYETSAGLTVHREVGLNQDGELLKYYLDQHNCLYLTGNHKNLVVATGPDGAVLLGSVA